jgi:hypothetical protein
MAVSMKQPLGPCASRTLKARGLCRPIQCSPAASIRMDDATISKPAARSFDPGQMRAATHWRLHNRKVDDIEGYLVSTMSIKFTTLCPVVREADIADLERSIGHSLPTDYRQFLLQNPGGFCSPYVCDNPYVSIVEWYAVKKDPVTQNVSLLSEQHEDFRRRYQSSSYPEAVLPFAMQSSQYPLVLSLAGISIGSVFAWHWDKPDADALRIKFLTFQEMLSALREELE